MTHDEIRRRALHAAAAVSFTIGLVACGSAVIVEPGTEDGAGGTAGAAPVTTTTTTTDTVADAGPTCPQGPDWGTCCDQNNWDIDAGCLAWGPPMPPEMALEVA